MSNPKTQAEFLHQYIDDTREHFNEDLYSRSEDRIIEELKKILLSCQREKFFTLKITNFTVVEDYAEIYKILREREAEKSDSKDKSFNKYDYLNLKDSDIKLLIVDWYIRVKKPKPNLPQETNLRVLIMIPRYVDKYYFRIFGNYYIAKVQIVDGSTYNNSQSRSKNDNVTLKSLFMATRIYRYKIDMVCVDGTPLSGIYYTSRIFSKLVPVMKYLLARYGLLGTLNELMVHNIYVSNEDPHDDNMYTVGNKYGLFISIDKYIYDNDITAQSLFYTIFISCKKQADAHEVYTNEYWLRSLGESYEKKTVEKGLSVLESLESIYDIPTKESLRLPEEDKADIYRVLIWIIREFSALRLKDNLDISTKRIRTEDYIAGLYVIKLSTSLYKLSEAGENVQIPDIVRRIHIFPDYLLKAMTNDDSVINIRNNVNDLDDSFLAIKYTFKGLSGLGENKQSSIPQGYRYIHKSHIGRIDLDSSPANDPGLSGMLCPTVPLYDKYFADFSEPNTWRNEVRDMMKSYAKLRQLKQAYQLQESIGIKNPASEAIDDEIAFTENLVLPYVINIDESMITISMTNPYDIIED